MSHVSWALAWTDQQSRGDSRFFSEAVDHHSTAEVSGNGEMEKSPEGMLSWISQTENSMQGSATCSAPARAAPLDAVD